MGPGGRGGLAATLFVLLLPSTAAGATLEVRHRTGGGDPRATSQPLADIRYLAADGERNQLTIFSDTEGIHVRDPGAVIQWTGDCRPSGAEILCAPALIDKAYVEAGDQSDSVDVSRARIIGGSGDDVLTAPEGVVDGGPGADALNGETVTYADRTEPISATVDGVANDGVAGEGDDVKGARFLQGGSANDVLAGAGGSGGDGDDRLVGGGGEDSLSGGNGDDSLEGLGARDTLSGGFGADRLRGGSGEDTVHPTRAAPVTVTADDAPGDGAPGEGDDVGSDIEVIYGTAYDDSLTGSDADNVLLGSDGADMLNGAGGDDEIDAGYGRDRVDGGPGRDRIRLVDGGDTLMLRDGERDSAFCQASGAASADFDPFDEVTGCVWNVAFARTRTLRTSADGRVRVEIRCISYTGHRCRGQIRLVHSKSKRTLATGPYDLGPNGWGRIPLELAAAGRAARRERARLPVFALAVPRGAPSGDSVYAYDNLRCAWITRSR